VSVLLERFYPKAYVCSLAGLNAEYFHNKGIKGIIFDLDNTLLPWKDGEFSSITVDILNAFRDEGLKLIVVSNAKSKRVNGLIDPLGIPGVSKAAKPRRKPFFKALEILGTKVSETAVVGDQLFTDIYGGNRIGLHTVLVVPMCKKELFITKLVRVLEKKVLNKLVEDGVIELPSVGK
jgi:HAD superfamily phosphatase (TIGR01668 family)